MRVLDLFCGAGGASLGLASLGLRPIGFDNDADACTTHSTAGHRTEQADLSSIHWYEWLGWNRGLYPVLHASPPCQPFSPAGKGAGRIDPRDGMPHALRAVAVIRPVLVTVENVKGLTYRKHQTYLDWFLAELRGLGYTVDHRVLNAADYGVPQTRQRLFVVGHRGGVVPKWPDPTHAKGGADGLAPWVSMAEALGWGWTDTPGRTVCGDRNVRWAYGIGSSYSTGRTLHDWLLSTGRAWNQVKGGSQAIPIEEPAPTVSSVLGQWWRQRPATTVNGDVRISRPGHHAEDESGSQQRDAVRVELHELAVLQGFPVDYPFQGTRTSRARQIGNAVPPQLLAAVVGANLDRI